MYIIDMVQSMFTSVVSISVLLYVWYKFRQARNMKYEVTRAHFG